MTNRFHQPTIPGRSMCRLKLATGLAILIFLSNSACDSVLKRPGNDGDLYPENYGKITTHLESADEKVSGILYQVFKPDRSLVEETYAPLSKLTLPSNLSPMGGGVHRFADAYFVLPGGNYTVRIVPMESATKPSETCLPAEKEVTVIPSQTTEIILVSNCGAAQNGGLDIVAVLDHAPTITSLQFNPAKFFTTCTPLEIAVKASDPDGDPLAISWKVVNKPQNPSYEFIPQGNVLKFMSRSAGDYEMKVSACETFKGGRCASLSFPLHVQMSKDVNKNGIGDECETKTVTVTWSTDKDFEQGSQTSVKYLNDSMVLDLSGVSGNQNMWIPSTGDDEIVLFDLKTLNPINGSPFPCCEKPSRLARDPEGNVFITCQGDGHVMKMDLHGHVLWDKDLSHCCGNSLGGAIYVPRSGGKSELYVGCLTKGKTFVLDADSGSSKHTIPTASVYGMATDGERIYLSGRHAGVVQAIDLTTQKVIWTNADTTPYGITARDGKVWISSCSEGRACKIDGKKGNTEKCIDYTSGSCGRGIAFSPVDGKIWLAISDENEVARIDPQTGQIDQFPTHGSKSLSVDFDAENNVYIVNRHSDNVTKLDSLGNFLDQFGDDVLTCPKTYSSDLTGMQVIQYAKSGTWHSNGVQLTNSTGNSKGASVEKIAWQGTTPSGTALIVEYQVDQNGVWKQAVNGSAPSGSHAHIQFRISLSTSNPQISPKLDELTLTYKVD